MDVDRIITEAGKTNEQLSDAEEQEIRKRLSHSEAKLAYLDDEVIRAQYAFNALLARRADQARQVEGFRIALAPHKKLATETLIEIFSHCVSEGITIPPSPHDMLWILGRVCSRWRHVVTTTPNLWSTIALSRLDLRDHSHAARLMDISRDIMSRSGSSPLSFRLSVAPGVSSHTFFDELDPMSALVIPHSHRLKVLHLRLSPVSFRQFFKLPPHSIDLLESVHFENSQGHSLLMDYITVFRYAASLRKVTFVWFQSCPSDPRLLQLPWHQLTDLHFLNTFVLPVMCHAVLRECTNLVNCSVALLDLDRTTQATLNCLPVTLLPKLTTLVINVGLNADYSTFIRPFVLPILKDFTVKSHSSATGWAQPEFLSLAARSSFSLERLVISFPICVPHLETLLSGLPYLVELDLQAADPLTSSTLALMAQEDCLPKLEVLKLTATAWPEVVAMLEARSSLPGTARLKRLFVVEIHDVLGTVTSLPTDAALEKRLEKLTQDGLLIDGL